jgi:hypothetical protein
MQLFITGNKSPDNGDADSVRSASKDNSDDDKMINRPQRPKKLAPIRHKVNSTIDSVLSFRSE